MSRPWMPLYIADYLADTAHLSAAEHGAYLLLIMHYWQTGGLPQEDERLARIARMTITEWTAVQPVIREFFGPGWRHTRIDGERTEAERLTKAGRKGGEASGSARREKRNSRPSRASADDDESHRPDNDLASEVRTIDERFANDHPNDLTTICEAPQPPPQKDNGTDAREVVVTPLISDEAHALARRFLDCIGFSPSGMLPPEFCGVPYRAQVWIRNNWTEGILIATAQKVMQGRASPPHINYFEKCFANAFASLAADVPQGSPTEISHGKTGNVLAATDRALERVASALARTESAAEGGICLEAGPETVRAISAE